MKFGEVLVSERHPRGHLWVHFVTCAIIFHKCVCKRKSTILKTRGLVMTETKMQKVRYLWTDPRMQDRQQDFLTGYLLWICAVCLNFGNQRSGSSNGHVQINETQSTVTPRVCHVQLVEFSEFGCHVMSDTLLHAAYHFTPAFV